MIFQLLLLLGINYAGMIIGEGLKLPTPGAVNGLLLLFFLLYTKVLKVNDIDKVCDFLLINMIITFLPAGVRLIDSLNLLQESFFKLIMLLIITTVLTMAVTALSVDFLIKRRDKK
ncbi:CidA/LrgA family protein [Cetobacterium sp. 2A]|uniref:CidA/LrgA family protein n=1 Tax=Cetobacterium sp. 2A TaxID=2754723 RepID=UPI00163C6EB9|nr:CidA/LrgA family protein [Cetobacterium sp. 2A]MBC2855784.1 CidA/LrgA family protein [Cetobacterium sp. 2A]